MILDIFCISQGYWRPKILKANYDRKDIKLLAAKKSLKEIHPLPIKSNILSFEPLPTRESPVTQKLSQARRIERTWDQRQS